MSLHEWYQKGLTAQEYMDGMGTNQEEMLHILEQFSLTDEERASLAPLRAQSLRVIVITEDWCGDAMLNNSILLKVAEEIGMETRFLHRDQNLELMDQYLTNGTARSIPIFIFMDEAGEEVAVWGPRAESLQELVDEKRSNLPSQDNPLFKDAQLEMYKGLMTAYKSDAALWHAVAQSIIRRLQDTLSN